MKEIAKLTGLSESQFGRAFKLSMGISPHQWQIRTRIVEAQELLKEGKLPLRKLRLLHVSRNRVISHASLKISLAFRLESGGARIARSSLPPLL
jgi:AraC-like DNA-binding protein